MDESFLNKLFDRLSTNINFPYYQAERRIDIFINFFIEDIVRQKTKFKNAQFICPEFPLKKSSASAHAAHIDYLMVDNTLKTVVMVELKTDDISYDQSQIDFYLTHLFFKKWFDDFETIKMKKFKWKRDYLSTKLKEIAGDYSSLIVEVVVLKPTVDLIRDLSEMKDENKINKVHFVELKSCEIITEYQKEWDIFKQSVLLNLIQK